MLFQGASDHVIITVLHQDGQEAPAAAEVKPDANSGGGARFAGGIPSPHKRKSYARKASLKQRMSGKEGRKSVVETLHSVSTFWSTLAEEEDHKELGTFARTFSKMGGAI